MTALTAIPVHPISAPRQAFESVSMTSRQDRHRGTFTELRDLQRQRMLQIAAVSTGIVSVSALASAAAVLGLSA
ncbi:MULTISPECIES: hypothetical protein [Curtobacterium]|uniref:Uncharacterized protein n=1 Tax=Curtobacterium citreum TaxID=2036 RepID=A0ABU8Y8Z1_9MICO|nr:hypothetical protein [Curtobacterium sp. JUb34]PZO61462.1 MAG: hypothetical protein DI639_00460 [Leifsonia xyli]ROR30920.1 hypothetical protein EDF63_2350 [Curtobacterium sp. JUb34]